MSDSAQPMGVVLLSGLDDLHGWRATHGGGTRALVPTMGALHAGHAALIARARADLGGDGRVLVSIFVNPRQFAAGEDLARYPRTLAADCRLAAAAGADAVWAPSVADIYPAPADEGGTPSVPTIHAMTVRPDLADRWEAAARPHHFDGVLTVVNRLFEVTQPDLAYFGEKDYQQLVLVTALAAQRFPALQVVPVPTVRDDDGVALSSRNVFLTDDERRQARALPAALGAAATALAAGRPADWVCADVRGRLTKAGLEVDYVAVSPPLLPGFDGAGRLLAAVRCGSVRLLDTRAVGRDERTR
ncbi:MAG: pantoate--beta-alanine ligase [Actinomycetales bacterium]|nr:pantoate--beta-alanine ligase [Actinomycetales bacterium]